MFPGSSEGLSFHVKHHPCPSAAGEIQNSGAIDVHARLRPRSRTETRFNNQKRLYRSPSDVLRQLRSRCADAARNCRPYNPCQVSSAQCPVPSAQCPASNTADNSPAPAIGGSGDDLPRGKSDPAHLRGSTPP